MSKEKIDPFEIVAMSLEIDRGELNINSAMGETLNWDSLNHVILIGELESNYGIEIPDEEIETYCSMRKILELNDKHSK